MNVKMWLMMQSITWTAPLASMSSVKLFAGIVAVIFEDC